MVSTASRIAENYQRIRERIQQACRRADRSPSSVKLVAVTKYAQVDWVQALIDQGVTQLGESRPQQLVERLPLFGEKIHWHLIGHLQRNKARRILPLVRLIHSVDSLRLLRTLDRLGEELDLRPRILLQANISGEASKHGFAPDQLLAEWNSVLDCRQVQVEGLMTMAPYSEDPEKARPIFAQLRKLRDRLASQSPGELSLAELSMGMSGDFEVAIEEGATLIRIGSGLFSRLST